MKTIRYSCFETASSSCHSLVIARYILGVDLLDTIKPGLDGKIRICSGYYGREHLNETDPKIKASYFYTWCLLAPKQRLKYLKMLEEIISEQTGCPVVFRKKREECGIYNNSDTTFKKIIKSKELIRLFIFHPRSVLHFEEC